MTLAAVKAEITTILTDLASNPSMMCATILDRLAMLQGQCEALAVMESIPSEIRVQAAIGYLTRLAPVRGNLNGAEVNILVGQLKVYGTFAKAV